MKEARFINQNIESWERIEKLGDEYELSSSDTATKDYIKSNNDLSFARTFFPHSNISRYLNGLASKLHSGIHVTEVTPGREIRAFLFKTIPNTAYSLRKYVGISLLIFIVGTAIGLFSSWINPEYVRDIFGDYYVNMTIENIKKGNPMEVYQDPNAGQMFKLITFNNIKVSFFAFAAGLFFSVGTGLILLSNAVMFGTFLYLFYSYGVLDEAWKTIMIHGTIELSAIIMAAAAGMYLGASFMFPGTYSRGRSFVKGAKKAVTLIIGLMPFFVIAGFLESFVTRKTDMPDSMFFVIIMVSFLLFWSYFYFWPKYNEVMEEARLRNKEIMEMSA